MFSKIFRVLSLKCPGFSLNRPHLADFFWKSLFRSFFKSFDLQTCSLSKRASWGFFFLKPFKKKKKEEDQFPIDRRFWRQGCRTPTRSPPFLLFCFDLLASFSNQAACRRVCV